MKNAMWLVLSVVLVPSVILVPGVAQAQEPPDVSQLAGFVRWSGVVLSLFVVTGTGVLVRIVADVANRLAKRFTGRRPLIQKLESAARFVIYVAAAGVCVGLSIRLDSTAVKVIGGALAFAVGFAMRDLVAAFIAGVTIMFDRPFQVGDRVNYAGEYGDIIKIGLRSVQMNTLDHNVVTIPNNKILTDVTSSGNYGALEMQVALDFHIGVDQDVHKAIELVREACLASPYIFLRQPIPVTIQQVIVGEYVAVTLKARPYVFDCQYEKALETDVHLRVLEAFRREGIHPPAILHRSTDAAQ